MNKTILNDVLKEINIRRQHAINLADNTREFCMQNEEYKKLEYEIRSLAFEIATKNIQGKDTALDMQKYDTLVKNQDKIINNLGYTRHNFEPDFTCKKCNDTGYINGKLCDCVKNLYSQKLKEQCNYSKINDFRFADFNADVFSSDKTKLDMTKLYNACYKYCQKFPNTNYKNLLFLGKTGVGKTCLISAISNQLIENGVMVTYLSAFEMNQIFLNYHTGDIHKKSGLLDDLLMCDVLVIDDLGTEPLLKNVTLEYFFLILNQRGIDNKHTLISTNLTLDELINRYGERIFSRLTDKSKSKTFSLSDGDIRIHK